MTMMVDTPCPACSAPTRFDYACPGYERRRPDGTSIVMVCQGCGNAAEWRCTDRTCGWFYREPNYRSDRDQMGVRPDWIEAAYQEAMCWDDDDD